jgi:hypothetical protein
MEELTVPADRILDVATRIADLLLDVQTRVNGQIDAALAELLREPHTVQVTLEGLTEADLEHYIELSTGAEPPLELVHAPLQVVDQLERGAVEDALVLRERLDVPAHQLAQRLLHERARPRPPQRLLRRDRPVPLRQLVRPRAAAEAPRRLALQPLVDLVHIRKCPRCRDFVTRTHLQGFRHPHAFAGLY